LLAVFFEALGFLAAVLRGFLAALLLPVLDEVVEAGAADDEVVDAALLAVPVDDLVVLLLDFDALPAVFFLGDAAFFFGLFALPVDFGFAVVAFFAPVDAFFFVALAAELVADVPAVVVVVVVELFVSEAEAVVEAVATFLVEAFLVGDAERFRFVPVADFDLVDDRDFEPVDVLLPLGAFDRLRDVAEADLFAGAFFFVPAAEAGLPPTLKLPLAPAPFVCFKV